MRIIERKRGDFFWIGIVLMMGLFVFLILSAGEADGVIFEFVVMLDLFDG